LSFLIQRSPDQRSFASFPELIAGCHVFRRLSMPRHPPCTLVSLTAFTDHRHAQGMHVTYKSSVKRVRSITFLIVRWASACSRRTLMPVRSPVKGTARSRPRAARAHLLAKKGARRSAGQNEKTICATTGLRSRRKANAGGIAVFCRGPTQAGIAQIRPLKTFC
jgi:hypothetical protein